MAQAGLSLLVAWNMEFGIAATRLNAQMPGPVVTTPIRVEGEATQVEECEVDSMGEPAWETNAIPRPAAPILTLNSIQANWALQSTDHGAAWTRIDYQPMEMACRLHDLKDIEGYEFYLDGEPYSGIRSENKETLVCPPLGRHLVQARYRHRELGWSRISAPVRFEVLAPRTPRIIAVYDATQSGVPASARQTASITSGLVALRLANVSHQSHVHVYLDGKWLARVEAPNGAPCVVQFPIKEVATVGEHEITVQQSPRNACAEIASALSDSVTIQYFRPSVDILRRGRSAASPAATTMGSASTSSNDRLSSIDSCVPATPRGSVASAWSEFLRPLSIGMMPLNVALLHQDPMPKESSIAEPVAEKPPAEATGPVTPQNIVELERTRLDAAKQRAAIEADLAKSLFQIPGNLARQWADAHVATRQIEAARAVELQKQQNQLEQMRLDHSLRKSRGAWGVLLECLEGSVRMIAPQEKPDPRHVSNDSRNGTIHTFATVARFPLREYSLRGQPIEQERLLIYEGMTLAINPDGRFEVRFRTSTPRLPANLRLQCQVQIDGDWHTITFPPVHVLGVDERIHARTSLAHSSLASVEGEREELVDDQIQSFRLVGDVAALTGREDGEPIQNVRRSGTARLGYDRAQTAVKYVQ